jgi:TRAP-type C4-dicarboxylate transport system substrate-binding protein
VQKHLTLTGHLYSPALVLMSPAAYNKMSEADRKTIMQIAREGVQVTRARVQELERVGIEQLRTAGMQIRTLSNAEKVAFQDALKPAYAEFGKRFGQANIDAIRNAK